jgi:hypothetical protein
MERKYKITSSSHIITMIVNFEDESGTSHNMSVGVDYLMNKVYFLDKSNSDLDYDSLEKEILISLRPEEVVVPEIPSTLMNRVKEVRQGKFDNEYFYNKDIYGK